jgi:microcystin-dependent protein
VGDDIVNVRQIAQYPQVAATAPTDVALLQQGGLGGPYASILTPSLVSTALANGGWLKLMAGNGIAWNGASLSSDGIGFDFSGDVAVPSLHSAGDIFVAGQALATQVDVSALFDSILLNSVFTVNGRKGNVILQTSDILQAGAAPIQDAHFGGFNTSPTPWDFRASSDQIATTAWVQLVLEQVLCGGSVVTSFDGRGGDVILSTADVNAAYANYPVDGIVPTAPNPALYDASNRIATTLFVDESVEDLKQWIIGASGSFVDLSAYAKLESPAFTGFPNGPTAAPGSSTGQLATTAFVQAAVAASTAGVATWNGRTGTVTMTGADITASGGALLAGPTFTGVPQAPTASTATSTQQIATTAFVHAAISAIAAGVASFNTRTGAVTLQAADVTGVGGALLASPAFSGTPTAPTAAAHANSTQLATTAYVDAAITAIPAPVASFNTRTGAVVLLASDVSAVGGAMLSSPAFTGNPTAPTAAPGDNDTSIATTAFVQAALTAVGTGVTSFNTRSGAVTLLTADVTGAGGAPIASPTFTGVPAGPTAAPGTNSTQLASTAFVTAAVAAAPTGVTTFNTRNGAVTLLGSDVSAAGGALLVSPIFTGDPRAPTPTVGDSDTSIATTAFVNTAISNAIAASTAVQPVNPQTGTSYAILNSDQGALITVSNINPVALTIGQAGTGGNFAAGWFVDIQNLNAGVATITPATSTINADTNFQLGAGQSARINSDGTNYQVQMKATKMIGELGLWPGLTAPPRHAFCFGQAISRTTYAVLFELMTLRVTGTSSNGSASITGVSTDLTALGVIGAQIEGTNIPAGATITAVTATTLTISANATGANTGLRIIPQGRGDGSTTFNLPDFRGVVPLGRLGMGGTDATTIQIAGNLSNARRIGGFLGTEVPPMSTTGGTSGGNFTAVTNVIQCLQPSRTENFIIFLGRN